jgi:hypothetical protein
VVGLGIVLATIDVVVLAIVLEIARRVSEGPLSGVFTGGITGALGGVPRVFPIGSGPVTFTPTSIALDDLTLGGAISLPTPPPALPNLYISDNLKNPSYEIQLAPQTEGTSRTFQVSVYNRSAQPHNITGITLVDDPNHAFTVGQGVPLPAAVQPGAFRIFPATFAPPSAGDYLPLLRMTTDDPSAPVLEADMLAHAVPLGPHGQLTVSPGTLPFGTVMVGSPKTLAPTLTNIGNQPADITNLRLWAQQPSPGFFFLPWSWPTPIPPGQSRSLYVTFDPSEVSGASALLDIDVQGAISYSQTLTVSLTGTAGAPRCSVDMSLVDFGSVLPGATATRTQTIRNVGDMPLEVQMIARSSGQPDFQPDPAVTFPFTLAPGDSQTIDITWTAGLTPGAGDVNDFTVISNDPITPGVPFRCRGATSGPRIRVSPDFVEFAAPAAVPATATVTIDNIGSMTLTVAAVRSPQAPFSLSGVPQTPFTVPPGGQVAVSVVFTPTSQSQFVDQLVIRSDDALQPAIGVSMHGAH